MVNISSRDVTFSTFHLKLIISNDIPSNTHFMVEHVNTRKHLLTLHCMMQLIISHITPGPSPLTQLDIATMTDWAKQLLSQCRTVTRRRENIKQKQNVESTQYNKSGCYSRWRMRILRGVLTKNSLKTTGEVKMRPTHFLEVENDSLVDSFSTNEIIKANSVKCYTPPLKRCTNNCLSYIKSLVSQRTHKGDERGGGGCRIRSAKL